MNYYNDFDKNSCAWLRELIKAGIIPPGDVDDRSIKEVSPNELKGYTQCHFFAGVGGWSITLEMAGWPSTRPVWTGSCPCQPFSVAGAGGGAEDERHLWPEFARLICECEPSVVFGEQVASSLGRRWLSGVRLDMEAMGYGVGAADLCAAGVAAPHIRQRLFWVAYAERDGRWANESEREAQGGDVDRGDCGWMAHTTSSRLITKRQGSEIEARNETRMRGFECGCTDSWLENPNRNGRDKRRAECQGFERWDAFERTSANSGMEIPSRIRCGGRCDGVPEGENRTLQVERSCGVGAWDEYILIPCADGKARRIKPGLEPLVDGLHGRASLLRGYGNAIVPACAAEFIKAFMECE